MTSFRQKPRWEVAWFAAAVATATGLLASACGDGFQGADCGENHTCTIATGGEAADGGSSANDSDAAAGQTSGVEGKGGSGEGGSGVERCTGDVSDDPVCWTTNEFGIFVSGDSGDDTSGDGTREAPFKTIMQGIASAAGKSVYVCAGDYEEKISLDTKTDGIRLYGGFECDGWTYATTRSAQVVSPSNIALRINGLKQGVYIENLDFTASDADGTWVDASSYGAFITSSKKVVLRRVELNAGDAANGQDGDAGSKGEDGSVMGAPPPGTDACVAEGAAGGTWPTVSSCRSQGGPGGTGKFSSANGAPGDSGTPAEHVNPIKDINNGGVGQSSVVAANGKPGTTGDVGKLGAAASKGVFSSSGYAPADGSAGTDGYPGQGGGGGGAGKGASDCVGASGGAGGIGGCGGSAGKGGIGGGASVALFSWDSATVLDAVSLTSAKGGAGGVGGAGGLRGQGALGAPGGAGDGTTLSALGDGGRGGYGGDGGDGGSGSGGTGGPSYALVFSGPKPVYDIADTTLAAGPGGEAGLGGSVADVAAPDGFAGDSDTELEVP